MTKELEENALRYNKKLNKEIATRASFMSNSKWFKLFNEIEKAGIKIRSSYVKFLAQERLYEFNFTGFEERGFRDVGVLGPFQYKEIEWISVSEEVETSRLNRTEKLQSIFHHQPISEIETLMSSIGIFEYERTETELKIFGYK